MLRSTKKSYTRETDLHSSFRDWKGMDWPKIARTSSSFLALPVTNVTDRDTSKPEAFAAAAAAAISAAFLVSRLDGL